MAEEILQKSYEKSIGHLKILERRLEKDVTLQKRYQETIETVAKRGFIRELSSEELLKTRNEPQWYVPPHLKIQKRGDECVTQALSTMVFPSMLC